MKDGELSEFGRRRDQEIRDRGGSMLAPVSQGGLYGRCPVLESTG
jgi:hypothetical protein